MLNQSNVHWVQNNLFPVIFSKIMDSQFDTLGIHDVGFKAEHGEHHQRGQHRREEVDEGDEDCIKVAVVVALVVT